LPALLAALLLALPQTACAVKDHKDWGAFKSAYVTADGRVVDTGNGGISHSEGQGYGMLLAEAHGDRATFDHLWGWTGVNLMRDDVRLFRWRYDPKVGAAVADPNNATDGDIFIAWALLRASRRWKEQSYANDSRAIRAAIAQRLVAVLFHPAGPAGLRRRRSRRPLGATDPRRPHRGARRGFRSADPSLRLGSDRRVGRRHP